jgi:hypothetical protein
MGSDGGKTAAGTRQWLAEAEAEAAGNEEAGGSHKP